MQRFILICLLMCVAIHFGASASARVQKPSCDHGTCKSQLASGLLALRRLIVCYDTFIRVECHYNAFLLSELQQNQIGFRFDFKNYTYLSTIGKMAEYVNLIEYAFANNTKLSILRSVMVRVIYDTCRWVC